MSRITTLVLVALALLFGGLYFLLAPRLRHKEETRRSPKIVENFDPSGVAEIFFENIQRGTRVGLRRSRDGWDLTLPIEYPAEPAYVDALLNPIQHNECTLVAELAEKPEIDLAPYGLDKPRAVLRIRGPGGGREILIGQEDLAGSQAFVLSEGRILRTSRNLYGATERNVDELRSRQVFRLPFLELRELEVERGDLLLRFVWKQGVWRIESPWRERADAAGLSAFLTAALGLRVRKFFDDHPGEDALYGLDPPILRVAAGNGREREEVRIGKSPTDALLAKKTGFPFVWEPEDGASRLIEFRAEEFRERTYFPVFRDEVEEIRVGAAGGELVFVRRQGDWRMGAPREYPLEPGSVEDLLDAALRIEAESFEEAGEEDLARFGLDAPAHWVQLRTRRGETTKLLVGGPNGRGRRYVRRAEEGPVCLVPDSSLGFLEKGLFDYAAKLVYAVSEHELKRVEIVSREPGKEGKAAWIRDERGLWRRMAESGQPEESEDTRFAAGLDLFLFWKGKSAVSEDPGAYHFHHPLLAIHYFAGAEADGEKLLLAIPVARDREGKLFTRGRTNLVYELDPGIYEKALALLR